MYRKGQESIKNVFMKSTFPNYIPFNIKTMPIKFSYSGSSIILKAHPKID